MGCKKAHGMYFAGYMLIEIFGGDCIPL